MTASYRVVAIDCSGTNGRQWPKLAARLGPCFRFIAPGLIGSTGTALVRAARMPLPSWTRREPSSSSEANAVCPDVDVVTGRQIALQPTVVLIGSAGVFRLRRGTLEPRSTMKIGFVLRSRYLRQRKLEGAFVSLH